MRPVCQYGDGFARVPHRQEGAANGMPRRHFCSRTSALAPPHFSREHANRERKLNVAYCEHVPAPIVNVILSLSRRRD